MNMNAHAITVDVTDLQVQCLVESESAGIDSGEISFVLRCRNRIKDCPDFFEAQYGGQALFALGVDQF